MRTGMLWFDNDPKTDLPAKVTRAAAYYQKKYGCCPNLCFVHPSMLQTAAGVNGAIELRPNSQILPNYFWLGINESATSTRRASASPSAAAFLARVPTRKVTVW